jgi:hypothetical protein
MTVSVTAREDRSVPGDYPAFTVSLVLLIDVFSFVYSLIVVICSDLI